MLISDWTPIAFALVFFGILLEVGAILSFRTIFGIGPRPAKVISFGAAGAGVALALFFAHLNLGPLWVLGALFMAFCAQSYHVWLMIERHWHEWQRRKRQHEDSGEGGRRRRA